MHKPMGKTTWGHGGMTGSSFGWPRKQAIEENKPCQNLGLRPPTFSTVRKLISVVLARQKPSRLIVIIIAAIILQREKNHEVKQAKCPRSTTHEK